MAVWIAGEMVIFRRDRTPVAGTRADRGSRPLLIAAMVLGIWSAIFVAARLHGAAIPLTHPAAMLVSLMLIWSGFALRYWAVYVLGRFFRTHVTLLDEHRLIEHGPYARVRNPSYSGGMVTCLGFGLSLDNWASLAVMLVLPGLAYVNRIRVEERALASRFGAAWHTYRTRTWALLPPLW